MSENIFATLNAVNVNGHTEKKGSLTYLSWAWAVAEVEKQFPSMTYSVWKDENNMPFVYDEALGYMVFTSVTIDGEQKEMWLPVMDGANRAMKKTAYSYRVKNPNFRYAKKGGDGKFYDRFGSEQPEYIEKTCEAATMFDINTAIMRCLVKNFAMFGLGLYIYAGEDLPEGGEQPQVPPERSEPQGGEHLAVLARLLEETGTDGTKLLEYVNEKFGTNAAKFEELAPQQVAFALKKLSQKKEKQ